MSGATPGILHYSERAKVDFFGRQGFLRLALKAGVPIVPLASVGAHETYVILDRVVWCVSALLGRLEATNNWYRVAREYLYGDPPATPLGEAEAPFWGLPTAA